ncbi:MAG: phage holin family protein [Clostridiales bacterium]|nr:phage holin family protein [Clostridiales bacterium]
MLACRLDILLGTNYIRDAAVIAFCANEALSITENAGLMGVHLPGVVTNAIELLQKNSEKTEDKDNA